MPTPLEAAVRATTLCGSCRHIRRAHAQGTGPCNGMIIPHMAYVLRGYGQRRPVPCPCLEFTEPTGGDH
jgi:hypothetical protein